MRNVVIALSLLLFACHRATPPRAMTARSADLSITVDDTLRAVDHVTKETEAVGGYVASSQIWREGEQLHAQVTLRVPPDKLTSTLSYFRGMATRVERESIQPSAVSSPKHERACGVL
ncbi:MAG: DUF4349 domain-containing protein [Thermoanaerobaculia bacterium]